MSDKRRATVEGAAPLNHADAEALISARLDGPLDPACPCSTCARWSRGFLRHLLLVNEPTGPRLITIHNVAWVLDLVRRIRTAVTEGRLAALRAEVAEAYPA